MNAQRLGAAMVGGGAQYRGDPGLGAEYRWQDAGCHGHAVHVTGNDNMH